MDWELLSIIIISALSGAVIVEAHYHQKRVNENPSKYYREGDRF